MTVEDLSRFNEKICSQNVEELEYNQTSMYEYPISKAINYVITNSEFIEVRFAYNAAERTYYVLIYKIENRERKLVYENYVLKGDDGNPECNSTTIYNVFKSIS